MIPSSKSPRLSSRILFFNRLDKVSLQVSGHAVFEHPQQPAGDAREEAVGMGQLWVRPRWARRALSAPGRTLGAAPAIRRGRVMLGSQRLLKLLLTFSGHMRGDKHSRAGQRVSCAASGAQLLGLGSLLRNDIFWEQSRQGCVC